MKNLILLSLSILLISSCSNSTYDDLDYNSEMNDSKSNDSFKNQLTGYWETTEIEKNDSLINIPSKSIYRIEFVSDKSAKIEYVSKNEVSIYEYSYDPENATYSFKKESNLLFKLKITEINKNKCQFIALIIDLSTGKEAKVHFAELVKVSIDVGIESGFAD